MKINRVNSLYHIDVAITQHLHTDQQKDFSSTLSDVQNSSESLTSRVPVDEVGANKFSSFQPAAHTPEYSAQSFMDAHGGWRTNWSTYAFPAIDAFLHADRDNRQRTDYFGNKLHMSFAMDQVKSAFDAIKHLLFSPDNPIDAWKITNMQHPKIINNEFIDDRIIKNGQLTLYLFADHGQIYNADKINAVRHFILEMERVLINKGVDRTLHPSSDVQAFHWQYASFRNEGGERWPSTEKLNKLHTDLEALPLYQCLSMQHGESLKIEHGQLHPTAVDEVEHIDLSDVHRVGNKLKMEKILTLMDGGIV